MELLEQVSALASTDFGSLDDKTLSATTEQIAAAARLLATAGALAASEIADRSRFELGRDGLSYRNGYRYPVRFLEQLTRESQASVQAQIRLGDSIRPRVDITGDVQPPRHAIVAKAMRDGAMGADAAAVVIRCLDQAAKNAGSLEKLDAAEHALVEAAAGSPADIVDAQARVWREFLDPDGVEPREEASRRRRGAMLGRERNGISRLTVDCDPRLAATLRTAFGVANAPGKGPVFLDDEERTVASLDEAGTVIDPRTREQRNHDVLLGIVSAGVRSTGRGPGEFRQAVSVVATVRLSDLESGTGMGWLDGVVDPASIETIRELACEGGVRPLILGANSEPLYLGRAARFFTRAQKLAMAVRDGGCVICGAPPGRTDAHHLLEVGADNGPTDIDNGVLLCPADHHWLHHSDYQMAMIGGRPHLLAPPWIDPSQTWVPLRRSRLLMQDEQERRAG